MFFLNVEIFQKTNHVYSVVTVRQLTCKQTPETSHSIWVYSIAKCSSEMCENLAFGV